MRKRAFIILQLWLSSCLIWVSFEWGRVWLELYVPTDPPDIVTPWHLFFYHQDCLWSLPFIIASSYCFMNFFFVFRHGPLAFGRCARFSRVHEKGDGDKETKQNSTRKLHPYFLSWYYDGYEGLKISWKFTCKVVRRNMKTCGESRTMSFSLRSVFFLCFVMFTGMKTFTKTL